MPSFRARAGFLPGALVLLSSIMLSACGGGGSGSGSAVVTTYPSSGYYQPVYHRTGTTAVGLSLVHAATPTVEYVVSSSGGTISSVWPLYGATAAVSGYNVLPDYLLYVQGGLLYELPLQANGSKPGATVIPFGATACAVVDAYTPSAAPQDSQVIVSTPGTDGNCGTADDGQVRLGLALPQSTPAIQNLGYKYEGHVYSGVVGQPDIWLEADSSGALYTDGGSTPQLLRAATGSTPVRLGRFGSSLLLQDGSQLSMVSFSGSAWQVTGVSGTTGNWKLAGTDSSNYYVYTAGGGTSSPWQLLAIPLGGSTSTILASGTGSVANASVGNNNVFVSVEGTSNSYLYLVAKNGSSSNIVDTTASSVVDRVYILDGVKDVLYSAHYNGSAFIGGEVSSIDETGAILTLAPSGYLSCFIIPASVPVGTANNPVQISFIANSAIGADLSGAHLETFDSTTASVISNGFLPTASALGVAKVGADSAIGFDTTAGLLVAATDSNGFISAGSRIYYYDPAAAGSLTLTTSQQ